jgi:hypothetical protein
LTSIVRSTIHAKPLLHDTYQLSSTASGRTLVAETGLTQSGKQPLATYNAHEKSE